MLNLIHRIFSNQLYKNMIGKNETNLQYQKSTKNLSYATLLFNLPLFDFKDSI